jgi:hypothetical protein
MGSIAFTLKLDKEPRQVIAIVVETPMTMDTLALADRAIRQHIG